MSQFQLSVSEKFSKTKNWDKKFEILKRVRIIGYSLNFDQNFWNESIYLILSQISWKLGQEVQNSKKSQNNLP